MQLAEQKGLSKAAVEQMIDQLRKDNNSLANSLEQRRNKNMEDVKVIRIFMSSICSRFHMFTTRFEDSSEACNWESYGYRNMMPLVLT